MARTKNSARKNGGKIMGKTIRMPSKSSAAYEEDIKYIKQQIDFIKVNLVLYKNKPKLEKSLIQANILLRNTFGTYCLAWR